MGYLHRADLTATRFVHSQQVNACTVLVILPVGMQYSICGPCWRPIKNTWAKLGEIEQQLCLLSGVDVVLFLLNKIKLMFSWLLTCNTCGYWEVKETISETASSLPTHYVLVEKFPLSHNGKVKHCRNHTLLLQIQKNSICFWTWTDTYFPASFKYGFGVNEDFFAIGGHSILVMQLKSERYLSGPFQLVSWCHDSTFGGLTSYTRTFGRKTGMQPILPIRSGSGHPLFTQVLVPHGNIRYWTVI